MKQKEKINYAKSTVQELRKEIGDTEGTLKKMLVDRYVKETKNPRIRKVMKKKIAVLKTMIQQKQLVEK